VHRIIWLLLVLLHNEKVLSSHYHTVKIELHVSKEQSIILTLANPVLLIHLHSTFTHEWFRVVASHIMPLDAIVVKIV